MHEKIFGWGQESAMRCVARAVLWSSDLLSFPKDSLVLISQSIACYFKMSCTIPTFCIFIFRIFSHDSLTCKKKWLFALYFCRSCLTELVLKDAFGFEQKISQRTGTDNCAELFSDNRIWSLLNEDLHLQLSKYWDAIQETSLRSVKNTLYFFI